MKRTYFLILLLLNSFFAVSQTYKVEKIEPQFWWNGMQNEELQIILYGKNISELKAEINSSQVKISKVIQTDNPNYLFVYVSIPNGANLRGFQILLKKDGKTEVTVDYQLRMRETNSAQRIGFNNSDLIYLITPDRFANGNPQNDNVEGMLEKVNRQNKDGRHGGDIEGIVKNMEYFKNLGVTALWINPLLENNQPEFSYHGYSITDFYATDPRFGTNEEYENLGKLCQQNGIKLIIDVILNHCGSEHWWMKDLPSKDWINYDGKFVPTNHRRATTQDIYRSENDYNLFVDGWFVPSMPDLNQKNILLADYLIQNSIWWVEYSHLQGIRVDTYPYPDMNFTAEYTKRIMEEYPNLNIVGEEWSENPLTVAYWQAGKENANGYVSYLPSLFDFPLQGAIVRSLKETENFYFSGFLTLYQMLANDFVYANPNNLVTLLDNHDMARVYTQLNQNYDLFRLSMVYLLTTRGIPQIFYGTEILMGEPNEESHGIIRSDMAGGWEGDAINAFTQKGLNNKQLQAFQLIKTLAVWRKNAQVIHNGKLMHFSPENGFYVYFRYNGTKKVMVVLNKNTEKKELDISRFSEMLSGCKSGKDVLTGNSFDLTKNIVLQPLTPLVLEVE